MMSEDAELLRRYAVDHSEQAFAELVRRHVDLVYSAALRLVNGDAHRAQDVAQQVFFELARQAGRLVRHPAPVGWLYTTTRRAALCTVRNEQRRSTREQEATVMNELLRQSPPEPDWDRLRPVLEDAMHELGEKDRNAVLLRFFENKSLKDVGLALGLGENAARMRVDRALDKLRDALAHRGVATSGALASVISANAVQLAPAHVAATLAVTSAATATVGTGAFTLLKIMTATQLKLSFAAIIVAGGTTAFVLQHQNQAELRSENGVLKEQVARLQTENQGLSNQIASVGESRALSGEQFRELLKLRGEIGALREQAAENQKARTAAAEAGKRFQMAEKRPATAAAEARFTEHETTIVNAGKQTGLAFRIFAGDNGNQYPTNFEQCLNELGGTFNMGGFDVHDFDFVNAGVAREDHPQMAVLRERQARQTPNGTWHRVYVMADGSVQTAASSSPDFDAWEKQNTELPPSSQ